jgi:hypothetical protein
MNVVMLMAGNDDSFNKNEFNFPKSQIEIGKNEPHYLFNKRGKIFTL